MWVEHPIYTQVVYCLDRVPAVVKAKPELAKVEPFKTVLSGRLETIARSRLRDFEEIARRDAHRHVGRGFRRAKRSSGSTRPKDPRWKRPYTELTYQPMQEVLTFFRANGYKTFIVTGGGQDFVRVYSQHGLRHPARAGGRHRRRDQVRL